MNDGAPIVEILVSGGDTGFDFVDGVVHDPDGIGAVAAFILHCDFELMTSGAQIIQCVLHVRLIRGIGVVHHDATRDKDSECEGEKEMSKIEFHA